MTEPGSVAKVRARDFRALTTTVLDTMIVILPVAYAADVHRMLGLIVYDAQLLMAVLTVALGRAFLSFDPDRAAGKARTAGAFVLALATLAVGAYMTIFYDLISTEAAWLPNWLIGLSAVMFAALMMNINRAAGLGVLAVVLLFLAYGLLGHLMPGEMRSRETTLPELLVYLCVDANGVLGSALKVGVIIVIPYLLFGQLLSNCGAANFFNDLALAAMGRYRGGPAKVAVTASALFGSISGNAVGNVVGTGVVTIPMMKKAGFPKAYAGAVEAVASTGGQLVPPVMGAAAFIMADFIGVDYSAVMLAALPSALLYYLAIFINVDLLAGKNGIASVTRDMLPAAGRTFLKGWHFLVPFVVLFYSLFALNMRPERAAVLAVCILFVVSLVFGYDGKRARLRDILPTLASAGHAAQGLIIVCAAAGIIIGVLNISGLAFNLTLHIINASGNNAVVLALITAAISVVLGMGMPTVGVYILLATLVAPALVEVGIPVLAAHLFVFYFGLLSMVTPPVALASFAAANIAGADPWKTSIAAMKLAWPAYIVPFLFIFAPSLILEGSFLQIAWALSSAVLGIYMVTAGIVGFMRGPVEGAGRAVLVLGGILSLIPAKLFSGAVYTDLAGIVIFVGFVLFAGKLGLKSDQAPAA